MTIAMTTHFERLMEKATPRATQLVKVMGGLDMHDDDDKQCGLPTSMSKQVVIEFPSVNMAG